MWFHTDFFFNKLAYCIDLEHSQWKENYLVEKTQHIHSTSTVNVFFLCISVFKACCNFIIPTLEKQQQLQQNSYTIMLIGVCGGTGSCHLLTRSGQIFDVVKLICFLQKHKHPLSFRTYMSYIYQNKSTWKCQIWQWTPLLSHRG